MIARQPYLPRFMAGGPGNPLGARAMYLGTTVYRIHGTNRPDTIGTAVSSGCFRLVNTDVADLYERVPLGAKVSSGRSQNCNHDARRLFSRSARYISAEAATKGCTGDYSFSIRCVLPLFSPGFCFGVAGVSDEYSPSSGLGW